MPTLSIRVDDATRKAIDAAAKAAGFETYADFLRSVIKAALRGDDARITGDDNVVQASYTVVQENTLLRAELALKDELLRAREAHIGDLQVQLGILGRLALPPPTPEVKKKKKWFWQRAKSEK
jgi:hypothetical protein